MIAVIAVAQPVSEMRGEYAVSSAHAMQVAPTSLPITSAYTFEHLMDNAEAVMHYGMANAPRNGEPDHDFASAMIPHHRGAVDMAKVELLYGKDPVLRRIAQEIIVTQQQEIAVMQRRLDALQANRQQPIGKP